MPSIVFIDKTCSKPSFLRKPSNLLFGPDTLLSQEGPQQGDPLDPLLFCNAFHDLIDSLSADLNLSYLDDLTLGGPEKIIAQDVQRIIDVGDSIRIHLNISKCELISSPDFSGLRCHIEVFLSNLHCRRFTARC